MNTLLNLQFGFKDTLLLGQNEIGMYLNEQGTTAIKTAVEIYNNAYHVRLIEALTVDFPMLKKLIGLESFNDMSLKYIHAYPSTSYSLRVFGQHLSHFLKQHTDYKKQPYLAEMAEFEWQLLDVFDLPDTPVATINDMSQFKAEDWAYLTIKFHASVRWLSMHWNIVDIYQAMHSGSITPDPLYSETTTDCLIWRKQYSPYFRLVNSEERLAIKVLANSNFSELCHTLAELSENEDKAALDAATYLKTWLSAEIIESVSIFDQGIKK